MDPASLELHSSIYFVYLACATASQSLYIEFVVCLNNAILTDGIIYGKISLQCGNVEWTGKDWERNGRGLLKLWRGNESPRIIKDTQPRTKPGSSEIEVRRVTAWVDLIIRKL
jgi:hypothetical protein